MTATESTFDDGDVIFKEGDVSRSAYIIIEGEVELTKGGRGNLVTLARLKTGEMFGEMGTLDKSDRSATARAMGKVRLRVIPRKEFLDTLHKEPEAALSVMGKLVQRLRVANDMLVRGPGAARPDGEGRDRSGLLSRLLSRFFGGGAARENIEVRVATLIGDPDGSHTKHLVAAMGKRKGLRVTHLKKTPDVEPGAETEGELLTAATAARACLARVSADLLIWGEVPAPGTTVRLRFTAAEEEDEDRPGAFGPAVHLDLPAGFGPEFAHAIVAVSLAMSPRNSEGKALTVRTALPRSLEAAMPMADNPPPELTSRERRVMHQCLGNVAVAVAGLSGAAEHYQLAVREYRAALENLSRDDAPLEWAFIQRNLGMTLQTLSERGDDTSLLDETADCYRSASKVLTKIQFPRHWAALQNRLGLILYRLDMKTGDTELVKHALSAFQAALQVFSRTESPRKWAEVMSNFAQAAQMLGGQLRNAEVLEKAVAASRGVLEVRSRAEEPLLWAATQNNLGSALFLLAKVSRDAAHLVAAATAFGGALEVYHLHGATKTAAIAERNLSRVEAALEKRGGGGIPRMKWEKTEDEPASKP